MSRHELLVGARLIFAVIGFVLAVLQLLGERRRGRFQLFESNRPRYGCWATIHIGIAAALSGLIAVEANHRPIWDFLFAAGLLWLGIDGLIARRRHYRLFR